MNIRSMQYVAGYLLLIDIGHVMKPEVDIIEKHEMTTTENND